MFSNLAQASDGKANFLLFLRSKCFQAWILVYAKRGISKIKWRHPGSFSGAVLNEVFIHILLTFSYTFYTNLFERIWFLVKTLYTCESVQSSIVVTFVVQFNHIDSVPLTSKCTVICFKSTFVAAMQK